MIVDFTWAGDENNRVELVVLGTGGPGRYDMNWDPIVSRHRRELDLPEETSTSYGFVVQPHGGAQVAERDLADLIRPDPNSSDRIHHAFGSQGSASVLDLPASHRHRAWTTAVTRPSPVARHVSTSGRTIFSRLPNRVADVHLVMLDGDLWADERHGFARALDMYEQCRPDLSVRAEMIATPDRENLVDRAFMSSVMDEITTQRGIPVVVCGQSYGGHAAAGVLIDRPDMVTAAIVQSGSFWVDPSVAYEHTDFEVPGALTRELCDSRAAGRLVVQVGSFEDDMRRQSTMFAAAARSAGIETYVRQYFGGHDYAWYRHGVFDALDHLF